MNKEYEIKVLHPKLEDIENKIIEEGGRLLGRYFQKNYTFDNPLCPIPVGSYLRIREEQNLDTKSWSCLLTFKENIENKKLRENNEFDLVLQDRASMEKILKRLNFKQIHYGEKYRTSYLFKEARIDFDQWNKEVLEFPYMEIEVAREEKLDEILTFLDIPSSYCTRSSILELRDKINKG